MGRSTSNFPASGARAVTPSDSVMLPNGTCRSLYVGVSGDVSVLTSDGDVAVVFKAAPVGILAIQCQRVNSTGTTATNILALY
jgi:hypothetical protein